jgi:glutathione S-transferase
MTLQLFAHPFSSYCQKVLIALYENDIAFDFRLLGPDDPATGAAFAAHWPIGKFPLLVDGSAVVPEATIIIEHLAVQYPGPVALIPSDSRAALRVRLLDRFFDNYVMTPMQKIVGDALRPEGARDPHGVGEARTLLDKAYAWLEGQVADRRWASEGGFSLADCAAAPSLFYADWAHPIDGRFPAVAAYRQRLLERPSVARAVDEARPYRSLFPLGAPDRD